jgi:MFS family permease
LSYAVCGIFAGVVSDAVNRKVFAGFACIAWSVTTLLTGIIDNFWMFFVFRCLLGVFESAYNPCAYGIISDYFHPQYRTTANSLYNGAIYLGGALSSLATIMIGSLGWRGTYDLIGIVGIGSGFLGLLFIMEPKRGGFDAPKPTNVSKDERSTI